MTATHAAETDRLRLHGYQPAPPLVARRGLCCLVLAVCMATFPRAGRGEEAGDKSPPVQTARAKLDASAPSVVLLPPSFTPAAQPEMQAAAELACDRLGQQIAAAGLARVVDRTQLDRVLQERALKADTPRPMLSYDAMIRLEIDTSRLAPETTLSLIDLSTGNILAQQTFAWPLKETDAKAMLDFCRDGLKRVTKPAAGKLRVRTLWAAEAIDSERVRPLGKRLIDVFDGALQRSDRVLLVRHLEAATSKEESLLLLLGLSRLPGGRQFTPQADATIELRIVEGDGRGKTFFQTSVEIGVRLRKGAGYEGDWVTTAGLARDFDALIPQAWRKLARSLGEVHAETATTLLNEMALRRKQAEAELQTAKDLRNTSDSIEIMFMALPHAEAAMKLDPTYTEAVRLYLDLLSWLPKHNRESPRLPNVWLRLLREGAIYTERFHQDGELCGDLCESARWGLVRAPLNAFWRGNCDRPLSPFTDDMLTLTPEVAQAIDATKRLVERGSEDHVKLRFNVVEWMLIPAFRGMRLMKVPPAERDAWIEAISRRCFEKLMRGVSGGVDHAYDWSPDYAWFECGHLQVRIAELLSEDGQTERAKQIIVRTRADILAQHFPWMNLYFIRTVVEGTKDARLLAKFDAWVKDCQQAHVYQLAITWPEVDIFGPQPGVGPPGNRAGRPSLKAQFIGVNPRDRFHPLAEGGGRLYFATLSPQRVACILLDDHGQPIGNPVRIPTVYQFSWDNVKDIPQPKWDKWEEFAAARYLDGKLYLGTRGLGIQVFDPKTETWKGYGPAQGLPSRDAGGLCPMGGQLLYCDGTASCFTFNVTDGAAVLLHRGSSRSWDPDWTVYGSMRLVWRNAGHFLGIDGAGPVVDVLGKAPQRVPLAGFRLYGWRPGGLSTAGVGGAVEVEGRRFCLFDCGLCELDADAKVIRTWDTSEFVDVGGLNVLTPTDCPIPGRPSNLCAVGSCLVITGEGLVVYDVKTDVWYGPVDVEVGVPLGGFGGPLVAASHGMLWGGSQPGLACLALDDVVAYAKSLGRVTTTAEFHRRKQQFIDAAKPLDRAKFNIAMRQFDKGKAALKQVLDADPNQAEALVLMGFLHDRDCLNQPDEAVKYYRRAAQLEDNPSGSLTGMQFWMRLAENRQRWKELADLCEKMLQRFPRLDGPERERIEQLRDSARRQLAEQNAKQSAPATSNKEERPAH